MIWHHIIQCDMIQYNVTLYTLCYVIISCFIIWYYTLSCFIILHHIIWYHIICISYHILLYYILFYYNITYFVILDHITSYHIILYVIMLYHIILYYTIHIASPQFRNHPTPNLLIKLSLVLSVSLRSLNFLYIRPLHSWPFFPKRLLANWGS